VEFRPEAFRFRSEKPSESLTAETLVQGNVLYSVKQINGEAVPIPLATVLRILPFDQMQRARVRGSRVRKVVPS